MASTQAAACSPSARTTISEPFEAASMRTPMMLLAFTSCPSLSRTTSHVNLFAVCTMSAAGLACRPILLRTVQTFSARSSATARSFPEYGIGVAAPEAKAEASRRIQRDRQGDARQEEHTDY